MLLFAVARIGMTQDVEPFGVGCHQPVFDAVMDHLDKMAGAARPAMEISLFRRRSLLLPPGRGGHAGTARSQGTENRIQLFHRLGFAADHQAIPPLQPPDAAAGSHIQIADALVA